MVFKKLSRKGLTLIEVLVAITILMGAVMTLSLTWSGNTLRVRKSRLFNSAAVLLERKVTELELKYQDTDLASIPKEDSGDFGSDYPRFTWKFESQEFVMPDMKELQSADSEEGVINETLLMVLGQMQDYLSKAIKEAKITVIADRKGKKPASYSLTTYFVDFNQEFNLGGAGQ